MSFKPVYKVGDQGIWKKLGDPAEIIQVSNKEYEAHFIFDFEIDNREVPVYFAMSFPYSYEDLQHSLESIDKRMAGHDSVYYRRDLLIRSVEGRRIDLITISSLSQDTNNSEDRVHPSLFPDLGPEEQVGKR